MANLRTEVLRCFKALHRTRKFIFKDDHHALNACRNKINEEFHKNKHVSDSAVITELVRYSREVEHELRAAVVQAREVAPGKFELRITEETRKLNNVPYSDMGEAESFPRTSKPCKS